MQKEKKLNNEKKQQQQETIQDLWDNYQKIEREQKMFATTVTKNFLKLMSNNTPQIQEAQRIRSRLSATPQKNVSS